MLAKFSAVKRNITPYSLTLSMVFLCTMVFISHKKKYYGFLGFNIGLCLVDISDIFFRFFITDSMTTFKFPIRNEYHTRTNRLNSGAQIWEIGLCIVGTEEVPKLSIEAFPMIYFEMM